MLRFQDIVFGPIRSRRLGASLGVNLLPSDGKLCNFDCIYCECGWNRDGKVDEPRLPDADAVRRALEDSLKSCSAEGTVIDSITFSGNGEPTLNPHFPEIMDVTVELRDRYFPDAKISVLSNATMLRKKEVVEALKKADNPILKIDAATDEGAALINRPSGNYSVREVVDNLKSFGGDFILQTMFLRGEGFDTADNIDEWMDLVRELKPGEIMIYTIDRETPAKGLLKYSAEEMSILTKPLSDEGFVLQIRG